METNEDKSTAELFRDEKEWDVKKIVSKTSA